MFLIRAALCVTAILIATSALAQNNPTTCLLAQRCDANGEPKFDIMNPLADALQKSRFIRVMTYSRLDPDVRSVMAANLGHQLVRQPTLADAQKLAGLLNTDYTIWLEDAEVIFGAKEAKQSAIAIKISVFRGGRQVWQDQMTQALAVNAQLSLDATLGSIVEVLMNRLLREPFKSIRPRANENPASIGLGSGQAPPVGDTKDDDPVLNDFAAIEQQVSSLIELKRYSAAEQLLRESVDADPLDVKRRRALIDFLKQYAPVEVATRAIYGAADALGVGEFTTEVADLMLVAGRTEEAKILVNDAILTNPNDPLTRLLAAELRMREAHPDQAIKHIEAAFAKELTPFAFLMRATCRALNGSDDGAKLDVSRAKEGDSNVLAKNFARISGIIDDYFSISGAELRALFQKVNLNPDSAEVSDLIGKFDRQAKGCMLLIGEDAADMRFSKSHNLRVLALNLLVQTVTELRAYVNKPDQEVLTEARIDLGEFLKVLADARTEFERERKNERYSGTYWALWCGCGGSVHADKTICV